MPARSRAEPAPAQPLRLLLPPLAVFEGAPPSALARVLARADRMQRPPGWRTQLTRAFRLVPAGLPVAALTRALDADDAATHAWLRADPAHVRADMATARLMACGSVGLTADEAQALLRPLKPLFGDAGFPIDAPSPERWYLMLPRDCRIPDFADPQAALGDVLDAHLPEGDAGRRWRQLLNEAQVLLHNHPVNAERARAGKLPVNSLWFWGGGALPDQVSTRFARVHSDDVLLQALAARAGIPCDGTAEAAAGVDAGTSTLVDLRKLRDTTALERDWIDPMLRQRRAFELDSGDGVSLSWRPAHRWRVWRRMATQCA